MAPRNQLPDSPRGLWAQTATIDWCESNYELSYYIAEFWNTISNLAFIVPQIAQYIALSKHKNVEPTFKNAFLSLALVGVGSFCFHMTLAKPMQMFDETSMIVVTLHGFYLLYSIKQPNANKQRLATILICYGIIFLALYVFLVAWPVFHHTVFGLIVYASVAVGYQLKKKYGTHYKFWTVLVIQHLAFMFWLVDKHYCELLTQFRDHHVPGLLKPVFQFHAMWHLLMGLASHIFICSLIRLRAWTKYRESYIITHDWFGLWVTLKKVDVTDDLPEVTGQRKHNLIYQNQEQQQLTQLNEDGKLKHRPRQHQHFDLNQNQVH